MIGAPGTSPRNVLLVEDDEATRELERRVLARAGLNVHEARGVVEAIERLKSTTFHAIFLDYQLPDGDPWVVVDAVQSAITRVPIILVTGAGSELVAAEALQRGVTEYIKKVDTFWEQLPTVVERVTRLAEAEEGLRRSDALLRLIAGNASDVVSVTDANGIIQFVSPACVRVLGYQPEEMVGHEAALFVLEEDRGLRFEGTSTNTTALEYVSVVRCRRKDGTFVWMESNGTVRRNSITGEVTETLAISRDVSDRKSSAEALAHSEHTLNLAIDGAPIGMAIVGLEGRFLRVNRALCKIVQYTPEELTKLTFQDITHPDDLDADLSLVGTLLRGEASSYQLAKRYLRKNGSVVDIMLSGSILRGENGSPLHFIAQIEDITDRKRAEVAIRTSENNFRALIEHASDGILISDVNGMYVEVNSAACAMSGYARWELLGGTMEGLVAPEEVPRLRVALRLLEETGRVHQTEWTLRRKDGSLLPVEVTAKILPDRRMQAFVRDVSERKQAQEALTRSEKNFRSLVEHTPLGVCVSREGRVEYANQALVALFGYKNADEMTGRSMFEFVHPEVHALASGRQEQIEHGVHTPSSVIRCIAKNGSDMLLESSSTLVQFESGPSILSILRDVTEARRADAERAAATSQIRKALAEKEILLKEIHHRVKNNLQVIASLVNLQANSLQDATTRAALGELRARVRAIALLHEKLYQSKDIEHIEMRDYLTGLVADVVRANDATAKNLSIHTRVDPVHLSLDIALPCGLILNELMTNALKHAFAEPGPEPPRIDVTLAAEGTNLELSVVDNGGGLARPETANGSRSLGWMLVETLSQQISGRVRVDSQRGLRFTVIFPRA